MVGKREAATVSALRAQGFQVKTISAVSSKPSGTVLAQNPAGRRARCSRLDGHTPSLARARDRAGCRRPVARRRRRGGPRSRLEAKGLYRAFVAAEWDGRGPEAAGRQARSRWLGRAIERLERQHGRRASASAASAAKPATVTVPDVTGQQQDVSAEAAQRGRPQGGGRLRLLGRGSGNRRLAGAGGRDDPEARHADPAERLARAEGRGQGRPDVRNLDAGEARAKLAAAGFRVQTLSQGVSDPSQVGVVVDEQPAGAKNAPTGSVVTIYVGRVARARSRPRPRPRRRSGRGG